MGKKSKKNRSKSLRETLSRLATTVKADAPTVVLGNGEKPSIDQPRPSALSRMTPAVSSLAMKLNPFNAERVASRRSKRQLKKIAQQMSGPKPRRSRLPLVIALAVLLLGLGGYWLYDTINLPDVKVGQYLDYKKWLDLVSGHTRPKEHRTLGKAKTTKVATSATHQPVRKVAVQKSAGKKKLAKGRLPFKKPTKAAVKAEKRFRKLAKSEKQKIWKQKLAKLKQDSKKKHQKASHRR